MRDFTYSLENMIADIEAHGLVSYTHGHLDTNTRTMGFDLKLGTGACVEYRIPETQVQEALRYCREERKVRVKQPKIEWPPIKLTNLAKISTLDWAELMKLVNDAHFTDLHKQIMGKQVAKMVWDESKKLQGIKIHERYDDVFRYRK